MAVIPGVGSFGGSFIDVSSAARVAGRSVPDVVLRERGGRRRTLRLTKEALPFRPLKTPMRTRMDSTAHQGNVDVSVQKFGPSWEPLSLRGSWRNVWLGKGIATLSEGIAGTAKTLRTAVELHDTWQSFWIEGQELDFVWGRVAFRVHIATFTPDWLREEDIEWEASLSIIGPGLVEAVSDYSTEFDFIRDAGTWASKLSGYLSTVRNLAKTVLAYERALTNELDRIDLLRKQLDEDVRIIGTVAELPARLMSRAQQTGEGLIGSWGNVVGTINNVDAAYSSDGSALDTAKKQRTKAVIVKTARSGQGDAIAIVRSLRLSAHPRIVRIETATAQTDLRRLAQVYLGNTALWTVIAKENGLSGPHPRVGQILYIPEAPA